MDLKDKVVVITGAAGGIGKETARLFAKEGAKLALVDLSEEALQETAVELELDKDSFILVEADVSKEEQVKNYVQCAKDAFGRVDVFFNNAGTEGKFAFIKDTQPEDLDLVLNVNVKGVYYGLKHVIPVMLEQKSGSIINTASVAGLMGSPGLAPYAASKHAVIGLTKTAALECAEHGVRVNAVCPGPINTRMMRSIEEGAAPGHGAVVKQQREQKIPMNRYGESEEVAQVVVFLGSEKASFITGASYTVDGGITTR